MYGTRQGNEGRQRGEPCQRRLQGLKEGLRCFDFDV